MNITGEITSDRPGYIPDFGYVPLDDKLIIDEFQMIRIESKRKCKIGDIVMPYGVTFTLIVDTDDTSDEEG